MRYFLVFVLLVIVITGAHAQQDKAAIMGAGMSSCAEFAKKYREAPNTVETLYFIWAQGCMSGLNLVHHALKRPQHNLNAWPIRDQQSHLREFCDKNPLLDFAYAVHSLFKALPQIPPQSN